MIFLASFVSLIFLNIIFAQDVQINTDVGTIVGEIATVDFNGTTYKYKQFLGIPYAEPPVGEKRFQKPVKRANFTEPFVAKTMPAFCPMNNGYLEFFGISLSRDTQSEDCLRLNIFTPEQDVQGNTKRAVMVWIHGGFFEVENQNWYLAVMLAASQDIIYVTLNYRLSVLGFLSTGDSNLPGNNGLWDQHLALRWVHDNIESFGGDPERVTIVGESAGGAAVIHQALFRGNHELMLFQSVLTQSGSANNGLMFENNPIDKFNIFANKTGCSSDTHAKTISCLKTKSFTELLDQASYDLSFPPVVDGEFVEIHPDDVFLNVSNKAADILHIFGTYDIVFGFNSGEGNLYSGKMDDLLSDDRGNVVSKYTYEAFKNKIIPFVFQTTKVTDTPTLRDAVIHQYVDWTNPSHNATIRQASVNLMSDLLFNEGIVKAALMHSGSQSGGATYLYIFDHRSRISIPDLNGANHAEEVIFALGFPLNQLIFFYGINFTDPASEFTPEDLKLSKDMMEYWSNFVKTGNPSQRSDGPSPLTSWPHYDVTSQQYIRFKGGLNTYPVETRYTAARMNFWHEFVPVIYGHCDKTCELCKTKVNTGLAIYPKVLLLYFALVIHAFVFWKF